MRKKMLKECLRLSKQHKKNSTMNIKNTKVSIDHEKKFSKNNYRWEVLQLVVV